MFLDYTRTTWPLQKSFWSATFAHLTFVVLYWVYKWIHYSVYVWQGLFPILCPVSLLRCLSHGCAEAFGFIQCPLSTFTLTSCARGVLSRKPLSLMSFSSGPFNSQALHLGPWLSLDWLSYSVKARDLHLFLNIQAFIFPAILFLFSACVWYLTKNTCL